LQNGERSALPSFAPKIRVEVYVPIRYESSYHDLLVWLIEEFTHLRGGCSVNENIGGYYLSRASKIIKDRVSVVYSDFPMNWNKKSDRAEALIYCAGLKDFLLANLFEEEILISVYPVFHIGESTKPKINLILVHNS
jgi:hypothetical protein